MIPRSSVLADGVLKLTDEEEDNRSLDGAARELWWPALKRPPLVLTDFLSLPFHLK